MGNSIKQSTVKGFVWSSIGTYVSGGLSFLVTMILARLLTPSDFGLVELLIIFTSVAAIFVDSGFTKAIIRDKDASQTDLSTVFYVNITIAVLLYLLLFFCSPYIASYFDSPILEPLSKFVFLTIIFNALSLIQTSNLSRMLDFRTQSKAAIFSAVAAGIISIVMAAFGYGVWALAANMVALSFFKTLYLWVGNKWKPTTKFSMLSIKKYFRFGASLLIQGIVDTFVTNAEMFVIGKLYSKGDLGYFSQARKFNSYFTYRLIMSIQSVTFPALSKLEDNRLKDGYRRVLTVTLFLVLPLTIFCSVAAENTMITLFGDQWGPAGKYFVIWSIHGMFVAIYTIFINIFLVTNQSGKLLKYTMIRQALRIITIILLARIGIMEMLYGIVTVTFYSCIQYVYQGGKLIDYTLKEVFRDMWPTLYKALISGAIVFLVGILLSNRAPVLQFAVQAVTMALSYFALVYFTKDKTYIEVKELVKGILKKDRTV